jgi:hypothetical protein
VDRQGSGRIFFFSSSGRLQQQHMPFPSLFSLAELSCWAHLILGFFALISVHLFSARGPTFLEEHSWADRAACRSFLLTSPPSPHALSFPLPPLPLSPLGLPSLSSRRAGDDWASGGATTRHVFAGDERPPGAPFPSRVRTGAPRALNVSKLRSASGSGSVRPCVLPK